MIFFQQWFQLQSAAQMIGLDGTSSLGVRPIKAIASAFKSLFNSHDCMPFFKCIFAGHGSTIVVRFKDLRISLQLDLQKKADFNAFSSTIRCQAMIYLFSY